jgi:acyl-CoA reductase-like NAD-dependent aldehyde dehydrogenase
MADRLPIQKTYKLYIGGQFPRSESGQTFPVLDADGDLLANAARASRKDLRDGVRAARSAQESWAGRTAYNRGQILYRVAEMLEGRRSQFVAELRSVGVERRAAGRQVERAIDQWVWYAGWADKFSQVSGAANPVAGPYFNFTFPEPTGVVGVVAGPDDAGLAALTNRIAPVIVSGNAAVVVVIGAGSTGAVSLTEVLATSDLPGGVVNLLTADGQDLLPWLFEHRDVNAVDLTLAGGVAPDVVAAASTNLKRVVRHQPSATGPDVITAFCEMKTVWHPVGR